MVGAVEGGQHAVRAIDFLEAGEVVFGSQVHPPLPVHPLVRLRPGEEYERVGERRAHLEDGAVFFGDVGEQRGYVALAQVAVERHLSQRDGRNLFGQGGTAETGACLVFGDRFCHGAAYEVHPADELDALFGFVVQLEDEAEDVAGVDEADDDDVPGVGNLVVEDCPADARLDELDGRPFRGVVEDAGLPGGAGERPEFAFVVLEDVESDQFIQGEVNDVFGFGYESFYPVLGVASGGLFGYALQDGVEGGVAGFGVVHEEEGFFVGVNASDEGEFGERGADDGAVQVPAGDLVEVAALLVEEHEDELFGQGERLGGRCVRRIALCRGNHWTFPSLVAVARRFGSLGPLALG